jgi:hypothetical protein
VELKQIYAIVFHLIPISLLNGVAFKLYDRNDATAEKHAIYAKATPSHVVLEDDGLEIG